MLASIYSVNIYRIVPGTTQYAGNLLAKRTDGISDFKEFIFNGEGTDSEQIMSCRIKWEGGYSYINRFQYT